ncbi:MAG TPA: hypothetical protein VNM69_10570 [Bacillus sp. (in: firmicutes)]|uniref:hypothetical protein n=1 Tax=Bacillus litorisediminis TaxID=2922713 RepID=UPI001FAB6178|nr:hypothetical protein [Bacillus litorisediminis]HWO76324.1 hypothetical protein [Bacillus sp. (in: firmicutes)]
MFDPTAFENLKVVVEGAIYDYDLEGYISVTDRNDQFNLSKLSRHFDITFSLQNKARPAKAKILLSTDDLYKEINLNETNVGCSIGITFYIAAHDQDDVSFMEHIYKIWEGQEIDLIKRQSLLNHQRQLFVEIGFDRKITEDQVDDLVAIVEHCIKTLEAL